MFLFDTYALIENIKGSNNYEKYVGSEIVINTFILTELAYWLVRNYGPDKMDYYLDCYKVFVKSIDVAIIKKAMLFRYKNKKKKLSMTDCISYLMAKDLGIKFLTGDNQFRDLENVEFVK
ncbi:MAG: PIN domain-containing protein [Candidatus Nanoarchaeia archaeon]